MAYDSTNKKLYTTATEGISTSEVAACLGDYRVTARGRDIGLLCSSPKINKWSPVKPFRDSALYFSSKTERDDARRMANQGLLLPTAANAGIGTSQAAYRRTYLGYLTYRATMGLTPNYTYQPPRGKASNEPFRLLDFDGYMHRAKQPFQTIIIGMEKGAARGEINRFVQNTIVCRIIKNADSMAMSDLISDTPSYYYFTAEVYIDTDTSQSNAFFARKPDYTYIATQPITSLVNANYYQDIIISLDSSLDNKYIDIVIGINKFYPDVNNSIQNGQKIPATESKGFIEPWEEGKYPYYVLVQRYYGVLGFKQVDGFYYAAGQKLVSYSLKDYNISSYRKNYSDIVGISLNLKRHSEAYYVTGQNTISGVPSGAKRFMFKLESPYRSVVGIVTNSSMSSGSTSSFQAIEAGSDWEMLYLRFDGFIKAGEKVDSAILYVSVDGGVSWTTVDKSASADAYGFEFADDCDGSSVKLMLEGTI